MSLVTALRPPAAIYREEQNFAWWVYAMLAAMVVNGLVAILWPHHGVANPAPAARWGLDAQVGLAFGLTLPTVLVVGVLRMTTEVTPATVRVWFGWLPTYRRAIPLTNIASLEVVRYRPIRDCGGWGIRRGRGGEAVLNARGDRGVRLTLVDGSKLLIGSQRPEDLADALKRAMNPDV